MRYTQTLYIWGMGISYEETKAMTKLPKIALGAWAWGNDGTFGNSLTAEETAELEKVADSLDLNVIRFWEKEMK